MKLYIIRHGETDWNRLLRMQGKTDIPLNEKGRMLAVESAAALQKIPFDCVFTSPLNRAKETARLVLGGREIPTTEDIRLREISFGVLEGQQARNAQGEILIPEFAMFFRNPARYIPPRDGESVEHLCSRTADFLEELKGREDLQDKTILISTHGACSRALLAGIKRSPLEHFWDGGVPKNCAVTIVELCDGEWKILDQDVIYYEDKGGTAPKWPTLAEESEDRPEDGKKQSSESGQQMSASAGLRTSDFYFDLPQELIAQDPLEDRSSSRLLVLDKETGKTEHRHFYDILDYLKEGDCLVLNNTRVIPARLYGVKEGTGAAIEVLLLKRRENNIWETLVRPGKKAKPGTRISFGDGMLTGEVVDIVEEGNRLIRFTYEGIFEEILDQLGQMPLPPYITHELKDPNRYQTVYAKHDGSAAAPTAGLHFTPQLLEEIRSRGIQIAEVTLHVGLGTFRPVKVDDVTNHHMHSEFYQVDEEAARIINETKARGGRVICVGTTSCRTIESAAREDGRLEPCSGWTEIFIYPGYQFKLLDCLITNFHLPESTLLMLVSALAGREHVLAAYQEAVKEKYRFFSFGDAMLIL